MMTLLWSLLGFVVAIGILVTVHEWGHYAVARLFKIKVTHFSIGFGKPLWSRQGRETRFQIAAIPLGGYVRFADERVEPVAPEDRSRAFNRQSVYKRFAVVAAGPLINLLFAWWVFAVMFASGVSGLKPVFVWDSASTPFAGKTSEQWLLTHMNDKSVQTWQQAQQILLTSVVNEKNQVTLRYRAFSAASDTEAGGESHTSTLPIDALSVNQPKSNWWRKLGVVPSGPDLAPVLANTSPESPAERAGLVAGDRILSVAGQPVASWQALTEEIRRHPGETLTLTVEREGRSLQREITLDRQSTDAGDIGFMGASVQFPPSLRERYQAQLDVGPVDALEMGWHHNLNWIEMSLTLIKRMFVGDVNWSNLSGPVSIAEFSGKAMQSGWVTFLGLLGLLSLSLGILNLLPIPLLDGGHLVFYLIEMLKGTPVSEGIEAGAQKIGMFLILGLTFFALFNDVVRLTNG
ncbi:RIP metalloprotease RseP [Hydrogenovibrio halophilus]|uniref:RIP metalloprotease RseP n=1 Tax=Hydrogenovibrio halophilus TaxID=373391 RepID=UPI001FDFD40A|nr:RIP metalloprotease RseP [Hydrogenovibrio halophilus]